MEPQPHAGPSKARYLRHDLQRQCLKPNSGPFATQQSRVQAWLDLLRIDADCLAQNHAQPLPTRSSSEAPLDREDCQAASWHDDPDEWKIVRSKKSRSALRSSASPQSSLSSSIPSSASSTKDAHAPLASAVKKKKRSKHCKNQKSPQSVPHRDAEQVDKDIQRSFVGPAFRDMFSNRPSKHNDNEEEGPSFHLKTYRRQQLSSLVLSTLAKHPALSYFQGYHDILTVLLLTFDPIADPEYASTIGLLEVATERLSLHLIRDSMAADLQPIMGQLKLLRNLVRACDIQMAELAERASALPFFALPWLLTLFTHDVTDVSVSQCILDFVLAYGPASPIYLCAAVILAKKQDLLSQDPDDLEDPSMLHCLLAKLPTIGLLANSDEGQVVPAPHTAADAAASSSDIVYTDPDVELPSLASDRAIADSLAGLELQTVTPPEAAPFDLSLESLLHEAAELMHRFPLTCDALQADKIMGMHSVLTTWPSLFDPLSSDIPPDDKQIIPVIWKQHDDFAESVLRGPSSAIVLDPHPDPPKDNGDDSAGIHDSKGDRRNRAGVVTNPSAMLAVVSISGLLVAALYAQSGTLANAGGLARFTSHSHPTSFTPTAEAKQVLTLIVSLLSQWGRIVGGGTA